MAARSSKRWRITVAERKALVTALIHLTDAAEHVPVKQDDRSEEEQFWVERFTDAIVQSRALQRDLAARHYRAVGEADRG